MNRNILAKGENRSSSIWACRWIKCYTIRREKK